MTVVEKLKWKVSVVNKTDPLEVVVNECIYSEHAVAFKSPNGKVWRVYVDDNGSLTTEEVVS